ncbi:hypothetical protein NKG05_01420 [Oerskovia sp. M15]
MVQTDLRDARARLLADDLAQLTATLEQEVADESALRARQADVERSLATAREALGSLEKQAAEAAPALAQASEVWYRLSSLGERLRGTGHWPRSGCGCSDARRACSAARTRTISRRRRRGPGRQSRTWTRR